jgi:hypothetical protein
LQNDRSALQFRVISVPRLPEISSRDDPLAFRKHENCTAGSCVYDAAWGPHDSNYITWNAAVCTYPHFVSDESTEASWLALKEMGVSQNDSYTKWKAEGNREDCLEPSPTKVGTKWIVNLQPPKPDGDSNGHGDEDGVCDELAQTTFDMYSKSLLAPWNELEELYNENEYDGLEDGAWDELAESTFNMSFGSFY